MLSEGVDELLEALRTALDRHGPGATPRYDALDPQAVRSD